MENYLFAQQRAEIQNTVPEVNEYLIPDSGFYSFPHLKEFGKLEFKDISLRSLDLHYNDGIEICYIHKGKYQWNIEDQSFILYPGDCFITFPWQKHGSPDGFMDLGLISWMIIAPDIFSSSGDIKLGSWSGIPMKQQKEICQTLLQNKKQSFPDKEIAHLFEQVFAELRDQDLGYEQMVNNALDRIFIKLARAVSVKECKDVEEKPECIPQLERRLLNDLSRTWSLAEMAEILEMGQTSLNLLLRNKTGYTPAQYLRHLRILEAKRLLKNTEVSITEIAFSCGFSSSQHFSTIFKRSTGYQPRDYRRGRH